ncbi:MAG: DUF1736 domain-containing protein [Candidatus Yanofskybacteria bacterium]|nr:DUF1736 domain-containing protein [Candidatus Yanofskybacteria bacterium]
MTVAIAISFLIYGNSIRGEFVFDDAVVVEKRSDLKRFGNFINLFVSSYHQNSPQSGLYRPLTMASYSLNYAIFGQSPRGFHVINIFIHALNSVLLFWLVGYLFKKRRLAYAAFFLFLTHPIHTEAVTSIVGRAELLAFFWGFAAIYFSVKGRRILSVLSFLLAIWSKESAIMVLPLILYANWTHFGGKFQITVRRLWIYVPALAVYSLLRYAALGGYTLKEDLTTIVENPLKFAPFSERIAAAFRVLFLYLEKLVWPVHLSADYSYNTIKPVVSIFRSTESLIGFAFFALFLFLVFHRKTRKTVCGYGAALFLFPYLLISNLIFPIGTIMGERLMYFSSAGFVILVAFVWSELFFAKVGRTVAATVLIFISILFSIRTIDRNRDWWTNRNLFEAALAESPDGLITRTSLAAVHIRDNEWEKAEKELEVAQGIYKENSHEYNLLGVIADHKGDLELAESLFKKSIEIGSNPVNTRINLINLYFREGRFQEAGDQLLRVIEFSPVPEYVIRYAHVQTALNKPDIAIETINKYYDSESIDADSSLVLGTAYFVKKDYEPAIFYLQMAKQFGRMEPEIDAMLEIAKKHSDIK